MRAEGSNTAGDVGHETLFKGRRKKILKQNRWVVIFC